MKKLLIITDDPLGYQSDYYNWCLYLNKDYEICYLSFDAELPIITVENVLQIKVTRSHSIIKNTIKYLDAVKNILEKNQFTNIIVTNSQQSIFIYPFLRKQKVIFDIRTVAVMNSFIKRYIYNINWFICTRVYDFSTIITDETAKFYKVFKKKYGIVPVGANIISETNKQFENIKLLYIGVIRTNLVDTVLGFAKFSEEHPNATYHIIGFNDPSVKYDTVNKLLEVIKETKMDEKVFYLGRKTHKECKNYFDKCNVGVSYIPVTPYFNFQPPTKNFEYLLSGLACIATSTFANQNIINHDNGILIEEGSNNFYKGLKQLYENRFNFESNNIRNSQTNYLWKNIVINKLKPILIKTENNINH